MDDIVNFYTGKNKVLFSTSRQQVERFLNLGHNTLFNITIDGTSHLLKVKRIEVNTNLEIEKVFV